MADNNIGDTSEHTGSAKWLAILLVALLFLLGLWLVLQNNKVDAPTQSTSETRPNSEQNVPDKGNGSVTQDGDPAEDVTPDPAGTGGNTMLEQRQ